MIIYSLWLDIFIIYNLLQQRFTRLSYSRHIFSSPYVFSLFKTLCQRSVILHSALILPDGLTTYHGSLTSFTSHSISQTCQLMAVFEILTLIHLFSMRTLSSSTNKSVVITLWGQGSVERITGLTLPRYKHKHTQTAQLIWTSQRLDAICGEICHIKTEREASFSPRDSEEEWFLNKCPCCSVQMILISVAGTESSSCYITFFKPSF